MGKSWVQLHRNLPYVQCYPPQPHIPDYIYRVNFPLSPLLPRPRAVQSHLRTTIATTRAKTATMAYSTNTSLYKMNHTMYVEGEEEIMEDGLLMVHGEDIGYG